MTVVSFLEKIPATLLIAARYRYPQMAPLQHFQDSATWMSSGGCHKTLSLGQGHIQLPVAPSHDLVTIVVFPLYL